MVFVVSILRRPVLRASAVCHFLWGGYSLPPICFAFVLHNHHARLDRARSSRK
jgi:hypothetical protein